MPAGPVAASASALVGRVLSGRYRLLSLIGTGASADVYLAEDVVLRRPVAVKVLHPALAADSAFLTRFRTEAQLAASMRHPNLLLVHDSGEDERPFLVTEYLEGGSLRELLDRGARLSLSQALLVGLQAARGLDHAHRRGLAHRDIKPANLLFDAEGRLRVADFGVARALADAAVTEPLGSHVGTARYASPEQAQGRSVDGRSDVYSLAIVLIEAVTGTAPFAADTPTAMLAARIGNPVDVPDALGPLVPALGAAGKLDPAERPDAASLGRMLKAAADDLDPPAPLPLARRRAPSEPLFSSSDPTVTDGDAIVVRIEEKGNEEDDEATDRPERRRRRWPKVLLALALIAGLAGGGIALAEAQPWRRMVNVPDLGGLSVEEARRRVDPLELGVRVSGRQPSEDVLADRVTRWSRRQREGKKVALTLSSGPAPRRVPALTRLTEGDARARVEQLGLVVSISKLPSETVLEGTVVSTQPPDGAEVARGGTVTLVVSDGRAPIPVPDVSGTTYEEAKARLEAAGFSVPPAVQVFDDEVPSGKVVRTTPAGASSAKPGSAVTVNVSKGPELVTVPNTTGLTPGQAQSKLASAGLTVSATYGPPNGKVFSTDPAAGKKVDRGTRVALYTR